MFEGDDNVDVNVGQGDQGAGYSDGSDSGQSQGGQQSLDFGQQGQHTGQQPQYDPAVYDEKFAMFESQLGGFNNRFEQIAEYLQKVDGFLRSQFGQKQVQRTGQQRGSGPDNITQQQAQEITEQMLAQYDPVGRSVYSNVSRMTDMINKFSESMPALIQMAQHYMESQQIQSRQSQTQQYQAVETEFQSRLGESLKSAGIEPTPFAMNQLTRYAMGELEKLHSNGYQITQQLVKNVINQTIQTAKKEFRSKQPPPNPRGGVSHGEGQQQLSGSNMRKAAMVQGLQQLFNPNQE